MKCCFSFLFLAILTTASTVSDTEEWINFKKNHSKTYKNSVEENLRFSVFQANLRKIEEHNAKFEQGQSTYTMGMNKFGDLTAEEFRSKLMRMPPKRNRPPTSPETEHVKYDANIPDSKDWRAEGAVTKIKDQGDCGACWAFSAVGAIESAYFIKSKNLVRMSEQELVDCATECRGCSGGLPELGMEYVEKNGITTEGIYPFIEKDGTCKLNGSQPLVKIKKHIFTKKDDEEDLRQAVARQPVAVMLNAIGFQFYKKGIYANPECFDIVWEGHSVLIVGYGHGDDPAYDDGEADYWILKNSWGTSWGMDGYMLFLRNSNECDIASEAVYPVL